MYAEVKKMLTEGILQEKNESRYFLVLVSCGSGSPDRLLALEIFSRG
jgi:hypothetical protein